MTNITAPAVFALSLALLGGCATKKDLEAVRAVADKAAADASAARASADKAAAAAATAQAKADAAKSAADSANACCQDTQTKIDRMFKKSMYK